MASDDLQSPFLDRARATLPWEERRRLQQERFLATFRLAAEKSAAYREILATAGVDPGDVKGLGDLPRLPRLSMDELVRRQKESPPFGGFLTAEPSRVRRIYSNPGLIWQPGEWDFSDTSWAEAVWAAGMRPGDRLLNTLNYHLWPVALMLDESAKMAGVTVVPTGAGNTLMQVRIMRELKVNAFLGTPSFLMTLAQRAQGMGLDPKADLFLEKALVGAEMLPESLRRRLSEGLEVSIRQFYGTAFLGCLGYECLELKGLHVADNVIVEVVDPGSGQPLEPGQVGEIVATCFSPTYPLIRFATGDLSAWSLETCPCGRTAPMLAKVLGRLDQASKVRGTFVHPWQTDEVISKHPEIFKYQVVITRQDHSDVMTFVVELKDDSLNPDIVKARLERDIKDLLTVRGEVKIVRRGSIPDFAKKIEDRREWE